MKINTYIFIVSLLSVTACNNTAPENKKTEKQPVAMMNPMETVVLQKTNPLVQLKLAGELVPDQQTDLFAKINSYVKAIKVDIGDKVSPGQILMILEAPEIKSQIANAKSKVDAQQAVYLSTKATYERMLKAAQTKGAIAKDALDQIRAKLQSNEAQLNAARSAYNESRDMDNYLVIRAPFSGTVTERNVDLGAFVSPMGKAPLLTIQNVNKLRLHLSVPEANTNYLHIGDTIRFKVRSIPQKKYAARISRKAGTLDMKLRSEKIQADFLNTNNELKPFMVAETVIPLENTEATFFVPKTALVESGTGLYVIIVKNRKTKNIPVSKGRVMSDQFEIFGELNEGDLLLKMANEEIQEGTSVPHK